MSVAVAAGAGLAVGSLGGAAVTQAAGLWSAPVVASASQGEITSGLSIGFGAGGGGLLSWRFTRDPLRPSLLFGSTALQRIGADGRLGVRFDVSRPIVGEPVMYGRDRYALLRRRVRCSRLPYECDPDARGQRVGLVLAFGRATGLGPARELDRFISAGDAMLAGNRRGQLAIIYTEQRGNRGIVWLAERAAGGRFKRPVAISRGPIVRRATVTVGDRGEVLVAYVSRQRVKARLRRAGQPLGRAQDLGRGSGIIALAAGISPRGRAVVASQHTGTTGGPGIPDRISSVRAATRAPRATRFGASRLLDRVRLVHDATLQPLAVGTSDGVTLAFNSTRPDQTAAVQLRHISNAGVLSAPQYLGIAELGDVAARPGGELVTVGLGPPVTLPGTLVSTRYLTAAMSSPSTPPAAPELIAEVPRGSPSSVAIDSRTGRPTVAWVGSDPDGIQIATRR